MHRGVRGQAGQPGFGHGHRAVMFTRKTAEQAAQAQAPGARAAHQLPDHTGAGEAAVHGVLTTGGRHPGASEVVGLVAPVNMK